METARNEQPRVSQDTLREIELDKSKSSSEYMSKSTEKPNRRIVGFCCDFGCRTCGQACDYDSCCC